MPYRPVQSRAGSPQLPTSLPFAITISSSSSSLASSTHASCAALVGSLLTASPSLPREPGSAGAAYEVQRSGNVREIVPQVVPTSSRSGWPTLSRTSQALASALGLAGAGNARRATSARVSFLEVTLPDRERRFEPALATV